MVKITRFKEVNFISQSELKQLLHYSPETGELMWLQNKGRRGVKGSLVVGKTYVRIDGVTHSIPRLIFLYMTGEYPVTYIYRHNKSSKDNRWENLYVTKGKCNVLDAEGLRKLVSYDPDTGIFTNTKGNKIGSVHPKGYMNASIKGKYRRLHHMAWLYMTGSFPKEGMEIDHINRVKSDNRFCNLREVSHQKNSCNVGLRKSNTSGVTGVSFNKTKKLWIARISVKGKRVTLVHTQDFHEAVRARKAAEIKYDHY